MNNDTELSLSAAKSKFFQVSEEQRKVQTELKRLLRAQIDSAIDRQFDYALFRVPRSLTGVYASYDVVEMTLWLIKQCRRGKFDVTLHAVSPPTIRVSGWSDSNWLEEDRPSTSKKTTTASGGGKSLVAQRTIQLSSKKTQAARAKEQSEHELSAAAQRGELSRRVQETLRRSKVNRSLLD